MLYDAAVIGGGLAGAAVAASLARAGRSVILFEKERSPHDKVCGEFISHEGADYLARLGISAQDLGGVSIRHVRLARRGDALSGELPFHAQSLSRRVLDEALLERASGAGAQILRGIRVKDIARHGSEWEIRLDGGEAFRAKDTFLATGKHDLREWKRPAGVQPDLIAFKAYWRLKPEQASQLARHVELILFPGGYAGLQSVEGGRANLCLLVRKSIFVARYRTWDTLVAAMQEDCPHLKTRLAGADCLLEKPIAITGIPYGYIARDSTGPWLLGDQAAVIPSFSGDGMSIALHSAQRAAGCYLRGGSASDYQRRLPADISSQVRRATILSQMLVTPAGQKLAMACAKLFPFALPLGAGLTRIPARALREARA